MNQRIIKLCQCPPPEPRSRSVFDQTPFWIPSAQTGHSSLSSPAGTCAGEFRGPRAGFLRLHRASPPSFSKRHQLFRLIGVAHFLLLQQPNELCPMPKAGCNSSNPLILFPLAFYPDKERSREVIKSFPRVKDIERLAIQ